MKHVAVLGIGAMGLPTAKHLASQFKVTVYDINYERIQLAQEQGLDAYANQIDCVLGADVVLLAVRNNAQLQQVLFEEKVATTLERGASIIVTSTIGTADIQSTNTKLAELGLLLVDSPVSGGPARAGDGTLLMVVGATDEAWETNQDVLNHMAGTLVRVGNQPGYGQAMKTINQLLCGVHIAAAAEALALADALGLDKDQTLEAMMAGAAGSWMFGDRGPRVIQNINHEKPEVKSRLDIFVKDMRIVTDAAKGAGMAVPLASAAEQMYLLGLSQGLAAHDDSSVVKTIYPESSLNKPE